MRSPPQIVRRAIVISIALGGMAYIAWDLSRQGPPVDRPAAGAIAAGMNRSRLIADEDVDEGAISDDLESAGALWAKDHHASAQASCPGYSPAFVKGCVDYIKDSRAGGTEQKP